MSKPLRLNCIAHGHPTIEGVGERLVFTVSAYRKTKTGRRVDYVFEIEGCRHSVRQLAEQIRNMQDRDLERIARETARITNEVAVLKR